MHVSFTKELLEAIGYKFMGQFGIDENKHYGSQSVNLRRLTNTKVQQLLDKVEPHSKLKGAKAVNVLRDLKFWIEAAKTGVTQMKCKNTKHFATLAFEYLQAAPRHWLYKKDTQRNVWQAFYVGNIHYSPKQVTTHGVNPARTSLSLYYYELDERCQENIQWMDHETAGKTVVDCLLSKGYMIENPDLLSEYEKYNGLFTKWHDQIGMQFSAVGVATDDLDGNPKGDDDDRHSYYRQTHTLKLDRDGQPAKIVIDVIQEGEKDTESDKDAPNLSFWQGKSYLSEDDDDEEEEEEDEVEETNSDNTIDPEDVDSDEEIAAVRNIRIPLFPIVPTFDLRRHLRLRIHVGDLTPYVYNKKLGDKLILPAEDVNLIKMLVSHKGGFQDIVGGKGGGAIVLCAGAPGTGKTLTAEVYAEVMERALYSVQASQLGLTPEDLEEELLKAFSRAQRWNAILLIDEADVYVAARGGNLDQNAIVGVFLRVLEYYSGAMFLTTNRADLVDDAISSRCIAKIVYGVPAVEDQRKIWRILADVMDAKMSDELIGNVVSAIPNLSGRDIKNLLKLAKLVSAAYDNAPITVDMIKFVKRFKPTQDLKPEVKEGVFKP